MIDRRSFIVATGAVLAVPTLARAQRGDAPVRIALVEAGSQSANQHFVDAFRAGLAALGYVEGRNLTLDVRWAEGEAERFPLLYAELAVRKPDVIVVASSLGASAAKKVIHSIPVVFVGAADPVGNGIVASLARPGGNITGLARDFGEGLIGKGLQLLKEIAPTASRIGILWNADGQVDIRAKEAASAVRSLGMTPLPVAIRDARDLDGAFDALRGERADAVQIVTDPMTLRHRVAIMRVAAARRMPTVCEFAEFGRAGALIAYSADIPEMFQRAATYVDHILKGAKPGELPVEQATKFLLVINLRTARVLGLSVPQSLLLRADEVIQ